MDQILKELTSGIVYKFQSGLYDKTYGKTARHLDVRSSKLFGLLPLSNKKVILREGSIKDQLLLYKHTTLLDY